MIKIIDFSVHPEDKDRIKEMARSYFSRNPRLVKSFIRDLAFLLAVIKPRYDYLLERKNLTPQLEQEKKNLQEILQNQGLLAKIIVIRERFPNEFTEIQKDPTIISRMEDNPGIDINEFRTQEKDKDGTKKVFDVDLKTLINAWPQFKQRQANPANFILLGGSSGTEFREEIDVGQFINYANSGNIENFHEAISKSPPYKRAEYLTSVVKTYASSDDAVRMNISKSVLVALYLVNDTNEKNILLNSVLEWAEKENGAIFNQLTTEQVNRWIRSLIGSNKENDQLDKIISETPYGNSDEGTRNRFWEAFTLLPPLPESIIGRFSIFITNLLVSFANKQLLLDLIDRDDFPARLSIANERTNTGNNISTFCVNQPYSDEKIKAINLLQKIPSDDNHKRLLVEHLINWANSAEENQKNFAKQNLTKTSLWPDSKENLKITAKEFLDYYNTLNQEEKNNYHDVFEHLKRKGVLKNERKHKVPAK